MKNTSISRLERTVSFLLVVFLLMSCTRLEKKTNNSLVAKKESNLSAKDILGNPNYPAISYGGYRGKTRTNQPTITELKDDMKLLSAMGIKIIRTYNVQPDLPHASNILKAIRELKKEDPKFEMYVMLGAWIDCLYAWTDQVPNHEAESAQNEGEIARAVLLANTYPDIVKVIAVGNEAMVRWAERYFVRPNVILKWINHLQDLKVSEGLPKDLWITCSDDFASWGGGDTSYRVQDLEEIIKAVDYVSMHTYPYHNSHYNPAFWKVLDSDIELSDIEKIDAAMQRALNFAKSQYKNVSDYVKGIDATKSIHIGETGWSSVSNGYYGVNGSRASDEYKQGVYYKLLREWTNKEGISCFFFEAFDEQWKDANNAQGSENHFGLISLEGKVKYALWDAVDQDLFAGLERSGNLITKTYNGNTEQLLKEVLVPNTDYNR
jgi:exo-beta-1,3-glucanase (GH17 family)